MEQQNKIDEQEPILEQTPAPDIWLKEELDELEKNKPSGDYPEALKLEEGKVTEFEISFEKAFDQWIDPATGAVKKIIPVMHKGEPRVLWINCANPLYRQIIEAGSKGQRTFKVMRTGQAKATRYTLVKD